METVETGCCKTKRSSQNKMSGANGSMSFLSTVLLILLPKCPLCLTAYMSAVVLFFDIDNAQLAPFLLHAKPVMAILIILLILLNRKDRRTLVSLSISVVALGFLIGKTYYNTAVFPDWLLYTAFVFAIWYNGNFRYFYRFIRFRHNEVP
ncbi:hypothetical protein FK220_011015 [Flavobacteriaceae bacterium TP-CH-4]|uniref:MerC mercury resistance protein n=1 Tax=Pelagihabitans pacificus TaxID=2696054 RepID=A0A967AT94_9FLAO|nr:hypothetical protein [Pelagihabitans pacificus]NHF59873.1 hypothetical protein [Pelagihabitans pacificus]